MPDRWSTEQVRELAPDAASLKAAGKLAVPTPWSDIGVADGEASLLWGLCKGSGSAPYQACVDLAEPAYQCSCPSRKSPCKHTLALLLLWADGQVGDGEPARWAAEWRAEHDARKARAERRAERRATAADRPVDPEAARKRAEQRARRRADRIAGGMDELDCWLTDQVRQGLAGPAGYRDVDAAAGRLVNAQATTVASTVRGLGDITGPDSTRRLLAEFSLLRLLTRAYRRVDTLPETLAATVRSRVGLPVTQEEVLATPPVRDRWFVLGSRDEDDGRLTTRRVWLRGIDSGAPALVLTFAGPNDPLPVELVPRTTVRADLHFYPGARRIRAIVGERHTDAETPPPPGDDVRTALAAYAAALADDPWLDSWPMLLADAVLTRHDDRWHVVTGDGAALPLHPKCRDPWRAVAVSGGHPITIAAEWTPRGLRPLGLFTAEYTGDWHG